jgi:hypothetical protein
MAPYPNWRQVARKRIVTENADFDHHYLAAVATISAQAPGETLALRLGRNALAAPKADIRFA